MNGALSILAEGLLRIEYKLDAILRQLNIAPPQPMSFIGQMCPACLSLIEYQIDLVNQVVKRVCRCSTGKQPPLIPLVPVPTQETPDASRKPANEVEPGIPDEDRPRRERR